MPQLVYIFFGARTLLFISFLVKQIAIAVIIIAIYILVVVR